MDNKSQQLGALSGSVLIEQIPVGFVVLDEQGRIVSVNRLLEKQLAIAGDSVINTCLEDYIVASDRPLLTKHL